MADKEQPTVPVFMLFTDDDTTVGRDSVVSNLQDLVIRKGYTECEVRDYGYATVDSYETLFSGPLTDQTTTAVA
jgi:hypothetical protein